MLVVVAFLLLLLTVAVQVRGDFNQCNAEEWRPVLKRAYVQQKGMPPPKNISVKRVLEEEFPKPYRILGPFAPYAGHRTHKRLTVYVDKNNMFQDVECS
ncbi:hypothetical protein GGI21_001445 [Coemansia aciculifera]|uniref:Uncharacterized protein n=1 Tax=Coemansia aciculifera TaxID=417176 RepID=A0ACC1M3N1_9FUNG|nr:hypothetical protein IWW38_002538 [Coemansia aciculifera]KAJ2909870.1 hypothetical protein GGI21_001445 [Coemansia aciculifera]